MLPSLQIVSTQNGTAEAYVQSNCACIYSHYEQG